MQYIILDGKTPTHSFKDGEGAKTYDEVKKDVVADWEKESNAANL